MMLITASSLVPTSYRAVIMATGGLITMISIFNQRVNRIGDLLTAAEVTTVYQPIRTSTDPGLYQTLSSFHSYVNEYSLSMAHSALCIPKLCLLIEVTTKRPMEFTERILDKRYCSKVISRGVTFGSNVYLVMRDYKPSEWMHSRPLGTLRKQGIGKMIQEAKKSFRRTEFELTKNNCQEFIADLSKSLRIF